MITPEKYGNRQKHLNPNPIQRMLLDRFLQRIAARVQQTGTRYVLDAGCGEGFAIEYLSRQNPNLTFVGGDFEVEALTWGRDNLDYAALLTNLDIHYLPFAENSFPLVVCLEVLEHLPDSAIGLRELARVSSEYLLLSVPHEPWFRVANFLRGKHLRALGNDPEHLHNYTGRTFREMVASVIDVVWHEYTFPWQIVLGRKRICP